MAQAWYIHRALPDSAIPGHEGENEVSWDEEEAILQSVDAVDDLDRSKITARAELGCIVGAASARVVQSAGVGVSQDPVGGVVPISRLRRGWRHWDKRGRVLRVRETRRNGC
jgi:hypothetical protein